MSKTFFASKNGLQLSMDITHPRDYINFALLRLLLLSSKICLILEVKYAKNPRATFTFYDVISQKTKASSLNLLYNSKILYSYKIKQVRTKGWGVQILSIERNNLETIPWEDICCKVFIMSKFCLYYEHYIGLLLFHSFFCCKQ